MTPRELLAQAIHEMWHTDDFPDDKGVCDCPSASWADGAATDFLATPSGAQILALLDRAEAAEGLLREATMTLATGSFHEPLCGQCWGCRARAALAKEPTR